MARILEGIKGFVSLLGGGGVLLCVASPVLRPACLPWACPPAKNRASVGLELGFVPVGASVPFGAFIILPACVPCQDRDKGRKFSANFQIVEDGTHNRRKGLQSSIYLSAKNPVRYIGRGLVLGCVSPNMRTLQAGFLCGWLLL